MAKKTKKEEPRTVRATSNAKENTSAVNKIANANPQSKRTTQSTRFTEKQMECVLKACALTGWSIAQLLERSAIEKAVAICNARGEDAGYCKKVAAVFVRHCLFPRLEQYDLCWPEQHPEQRADFWPLKREEDLKAGADFVHRVFKAGDRVASVGDGYGIKVFLSQDGSKLGIHRDHQRSESADEDVFANKIEEQFYVNRLDKDDIDQLLTDFERLGVELWRDVRHEVQRELGFASGPRELLDPAALLGTGRIPAEENRTPSPESCDGSSSDTESDKEPKQ